MSEPNAQGFESSYETARQEILRASKERRKTLHLEDLELTLLPPEIGQLTHLRELYLATNRLAALPSQVGQLTQLEILALDDNQLTSLPASIGSLSSLRALLLRRNKLRDLPRELAALPITLNLALTDNPLAEPLPELVQRGVPALFAYLRSLDSAVPQYTARLLLVGDGNVGKTSLLSALREESFINDQMTTHGIEVGPLTVTHPSLSVPMTLNVWDFGGQEVYHISNQFFFSRRAIYLVVWRPREARDEGDVEAWCRRIRLRVGDSARIILVATHSDERQAELDYVGLKAKLGDILVGNHAVSNSTRSGIAELRLAIAAEAAKLPQMGELVSRRWAAARDQLLAYREPQITYKEAETVCRSHGLDQRETKSLANLLQDLGNVIYFSEDEGLQDVVVLHPEEFATAIGYVLEDRPTRDAGGVLNHKRLREIWQGQGKSYLSEYHPYFLRLMEKFDISFRLPDRDASLVAQLVPYKRPQLPLHESGRSSNVQMLSVVYEMSDPAPGLIPWLTVRHRQLSTNLHWRSGVFLEHREYASQALFELLEDRRLALTVWAPSPIYLFSFLIDSVENVIAQRWEGLTYDLLVPCSTVLEDGSRCRGLLKFRSLLECNRKGKRTLDCQDCLEAKDVGRLLNPFRPTRYMSAS